jgi:hypothetical protein
MPAATAKATYSLDPETVRSLERLARRWAVSKSEALRRAIRSAEAAHASGGGIDSLAALDALQARLALDDRTVQRWSGALHEERRAV